MEFFVAQPLYEVIFHVERQGFHVEVELSFSDVALVLFVGISRAGGDFRRIDFEDSNSVREE